MHGIRVGDIASGKWVAVDAVPHAQNGCTFVVSRGPFTVQGYQLSRGSPVIQSAGAGAVTWSSQNALAQASLALVRSHVRPQMPCNVRCTSGAIWLKQWWASALFPTNFQIGHLHGTPPTCAESGIRSQASRSRTIGSNGLAAATWSTRPILQISPTTSMADLPTEVRQRALLSGSFASYGATEHPPDIRHCL